MGLARQRGGTGEGNVPRWVLTWTRPKSNGMVISLKIDY